MDDRVRSRHRPGSCRSTIRCVKHRPRPRQFAALGVLTALAVSAFALPHRHPPQYVPRIDPAAVTRPDARPAMLLIGDSYAGGAAGVGATQTFAWRACQQLDWVCHVDGQSGTGYRAAGHAGTAGSRPYDGRVDADRARFAAEVVVVTGGRFDKDATGEYAAARKLFLDLGRAYPRAEHVVVEPFWIDRSPRPSMAALRAAVGKAARETGFRWIDSDGWLDESLIGDDGVHPTLSGHQALGDRLADALRGLDVTAPDAA